MSKIEKIEPNRIALAAWLILGIMVFVVMMVI